jgi:MFS family permease
VTPAYPKPARAWALTALLALAYIVSFVDRQLLGLLVTPIKADLGIGDFEMGLLLGLAFSIFYVTLGIPVGWLADRASRRNIVLAGITLWCLMTAACGLARSYAQLFLARVGVGVGEATLSPCALSLISDSFPPERRARAIGVYSIGVSVGGGLAYLLGGALVQAVAEAPPINWPLLGAIAPWQSAFVAIGLGGLAVALLMLLVPEPARHERVDGKGGFAIRETLAHMGRNRRDFLSVMAAIACQLSFGYSTIWLVALFQRQWQWTVGDAGFAIGLLFLSLGPVGSIGGGWLCDRLTAHGIDRAPQRIAAYGLTLACPACILFPIMPSPELCLALLAPYILGTACSSASAAASIVALSPNNLRAQANAIYHLATGITGLIIGPGLVGFLSQSYGEGGLGAALTTVAVLFGIPAPLFLWWNVRRKA